MKKYSYNFTVAVANGIEVVSYAVGNILSAAWGSVCNLKNISDFQVVSSDIARDTYESWGGRVVHNVAQTAILNYCTTAACAFFPNVSLPLKVGVSVVTACLTGTVIHADATKNDGYNRDAWKNNPVGIKALCGLVNFAAFQSGMTLLAQTAFPYKEIVAPVVSGIAAIACTMATSLRLGAKQEQSPPKQ